MGRGELAFCYTLCHNLVRIQFRCFFLLSIDSVIHRCRLSEGKPTRFVNHNPITVCSVSTRCFIPSTFHDKLHLPTGFSLFSDSASKPTSDPIFHAFSKHLHINFHMAHFPCSFCNSIFCDFQAQTAVMRTAT